MFFELGKLYEVITDGVYLYSSDESERVSLNSGDVIMAVAMETVAGFEGEREIVPIFLYGDRLYEGMYGLAYSPQDYVKKVS